jgi:hypothetical protein
MMDAPVADDHLASHRGGVLDDPWAVVALALAALAGAADGKALVVGTSHLVRSYEVAKEGIGDRSPVG